MYNILSMVDSEITSEETTIPESRIKGAEAYSTWGGEHSWSDHYARTPRDWADNEIRSYNQDLEKNPGDIILIKKRDTLYRWRNAYLSEYNSFAPVRPVKKDLDEEFEILFLEALNSNYKEDEEGKAKAMRKYNAFKDSRKHDIELKNLPSSESGIIGESGIGSRQKKE